MNTTLKNQLSLLALVCFLVTFVTVPAAQARWEDRSDELPGMDNNIGPMLAIGGAAIAALLIWKVSSGDDDKDVNKPSVKIQEKDEDSNDPFDLFEMRANLLDDSSDTTNNSITCKPILGLGQDSAVVGVSFGL